MSQRDQILLFWAKQFGYFSAETIQHFQNSGQNFEQYLQQMRCLNQLQYQNVQLMFVRHCFWNEMLRRGHISKNEQNLLVRSAFDEINLGITDNSFTEAEKEFLLFKDAYQIGNAYLHSGLFSPMDHGMFEEMLDYARASISDGSIGLESGDPRSVEVPIVNEENFSEAISQEVEEKRRFGKYEILDEIGAGGMGRVYKAWDPELDKVVAIKVMLTDEGVSDKDRQRFQSEARLMAKLEHPSIIRVHDAGVHDGKDFIVMDFVAGDSLSAVIKKGKMKPRRILKIMQQVSSAMAYAHENGVIHRDLKPSNVMISKKDKALVMDFGLAKSLEAGKKLTKSGEVLGTPQYMSPEQAAGETRKVKAPTDVYALGTIMYEMLTGRPTVDGATSFNIIVSILHKDITPPKQHNPNIAEELEIICMKALEKEIPRRYPTAKEMHEDINRYLDGEIIEAKRASRLYILKRRAFRNKWAFVIAIIGLLAISVATNFLYQGYFAEKDRIVAVQQEKQWEDWWKQVPETLFRASKQLYLAQREYHASMKTAEQNIKDIKLWTARSKNHLGYKVHYKQYNKYIKSLGKWLDFPIYTFDENRKLKRVAIAESNSNAKHDENLMRLHQLVAQNEYSVFEELEALSKSYEKIFNEIRHNKRIVGTVAKRAEKSWLITQHKLKQVRVFRNIDQRETADAVQNLRNIFQKALQTIEKDHQRNFISLITTQMQTRVKYLVEGKNQAYTTFQNPETRKEISKEEYERQRIRLLFLLSLYDLKHSINEGKSLQQELEEIYSVVESAYNNIIERLIQTTNQDNETRENFREEFLELCLMNSEYPGSYYQMARLYQNAKNQGSTIAKIFFKTAIDKAEIKSTSKNMDFFLVYFYLEAVFESWFYSLTDVDHSSMRHLDQDYNAYMKYDLILNESANSSDQADYLKLSNIRKSILEYTRRLIKENNYESDGQIRAFARNRLNFALCPVNSYNENISAFNQGIIKYLEVLQKLETITHESLEGDILLTKARIYHDLARLAQFKTIQLTPKELQTSTLDLDKLGASKDEICILNIPVEEVYRNYEKASLNNQISTMIWRKLSENYSMLGNFDKAAEVLANFPYRDEALDWMYITALYNKDHDLRLLSMLEKHNAEYLTPIEDHHFKNHQGVQVLDELEGADGEWQLRRHLLAFLYWKLGHREKLDKMWQSEMYAIDVRQSQFNEQIKSYMTNLLYIMFALDYGEEEKAKVAAKMFYESFTTNWSRESILQAIRFGGFAFGFLEHYRDPFTAPSNYRVFPKQFDREVERLFGSKDELSYHMMNHGELIFKVMEALRENPKLYDGIGRLMKATIPDNTSGKDKFLYIIMSLVIKKSVDIMEDRLKRTDMKTSAEVHYRMAKAFFRDFAAKAKKKNPERWQDLEKAWKNLKIAVNLKPMKADYHYASAIVAGFLEARNPKMVKNVYYHLSYAIELGFKDKKLISQEPAFKKWKKKSSFRSLINKLNKPDYTHWSLEEIHARIQKCYQQNKYTEILQLTRMYQQISKRNVKKYYDKVLFQHQDFWKQKQFRHLFPKEDIAPLVNNIQKEQ